MTQRILRVYANPYAHIDHDGNPAGAVPYEDPKRRGWVGAQIDTEETRVLRDYGPGDPRSADQVTRFKFSDKVVQLPDTPFYRAFLRDGSLLPADEDTARAAGLKHVSHEEGLRVARDAAKAKWQALSVAGQPEPKWFSDAKAVFASTSPQGRSPAQQPSRDTTKGGE